MRIKIFILGIFIFIISASLTGCTTNINDSKNNQIENNTSNNEFDIKKTQTDIEESEEMYYENSKYSYSYIDLGNKYYTIIYGLDDNQNITWTYETPIANSEEYSIWVDSYNDELIYVINAGTLFALDMESGEVKWRVEDENIVNSDYVVREDGTMDIIFGVEDAKRFISVDKNGTVLKNMDLSKYNSEVSDVFWFNNFQENELVLIASANDDFRDKLKVKINLDNYEVNLEKYEYKDVTEDLLIGKTISNGYYESYFFNSDGTVVISRDDFYEKFSVIRYTGTWKLEDGMLKIKTTEAVVAYNGDYITDVDGKQALVNYDEKSVPADIERECIIYYCPNYQGSEKIYLDGEFYSFLEPVG